MDAFGRFTVSTRANATAFRLAAGVFTHNLDKARRMSRRLKAGTVWINTWGYVNDGFEDGGCKQSALPHRSRKPLLANFHVREILAKDLICFLYVRMAVKRTVSQTVVALDLVR